MTENLHGGVLARALHGGQDGYLRMKMSLTEILFVAAVVLIIMSASRMSAIGNALGKFVYSFKKASKGEGFIDAKVSRTGSARQIEDAQIVDEKKSHS